MSDHPEGRNGVVHPSVKFEPTDLSLRAVLTFAFGLVAVIGVVVAGLFLLVWAILGPTPAPRPVGAWDFAGEPGPDPNESHLPAKPELEAIDQNAPPSEGGRHTRPIREQIQEEEDHLRQSGVDKETGAAFIPIEEAMERLAGKASGAPRSPEAPGLSAVSNSGRRKGGGAP